MLSIVVVKRPPRVRLVTASNTGRILAKTKTLKLPIFAFRVVMGLSLRMHDRCQAKWTSRTGNLPRKRRDITEKIVVNDVNTK